MSTHQSSGDDARLRYPSSLTDAMWAILQPLLPVRDLRKGGRPRKYGDRLILDSIFYVLRSGCPWRMLLHDLMPYDAAHRWFTTWRTDGTRDRIHDQLRELTRIAAGKDPQPTAATLDAQSIKSSEGGPERGFEMGKKTTGRKRHLIVDTSYDPGLTVPHAVPVTWPDPKRRAPDQGTVTTVRARTTTPCAARGTFEIAASTRHSITGLRALVERFPQFAGRCYLVAPETPPLHPHAASSGVGSLPLDQFLLAVGRQAEAAMVRNLWSPR